MIYGSHASDRARPICLSDRSAKPKRSSSMGDFSKATYQTFSAEAKRRPKRDEIHLDPVKLDSVHRAQICQRGITRIRVWVLQCNGEAPAGSLSCDF